MEAGNVNFESQNLLSKSEGVKGADDSLSQDLFDQNKPLSINEKNDLGHTEPEFSESFELRLSETQAFLPETKQDEKIAKESQEDKQSLDNAKESSEDVEMSNGSASNQDAQDLKEELEQGSKEMHDKKEGDIADDTEESLSNGEVKDNEDAKSKSEATSDDKGEENGIETDEGSLKNEENASKEEESTGSDKEKEAKDEAAAEETMEVDGTAEAAEETSEESEECSCQPVCHLRIKKVSKHLNNACSQLDEYIKLKRREDNKILKSFLDMLKEITFISENTEIVGESKIADHILVPEEGGSSKKRGTKRKSSDIETPLKETPRKKVAADRSLKIKEEEEEKPKVDFKDLQGLAVFAKWPNSGWYYPGKVEELTANDWKEHSNVTVTFYDGLVREMKNINILPAHLIPAGSMLCDLEDETEMTVVSCDGGEQSSVDFKLSPKDSSDEIEVNFSKLAIKALHMKTIKQQLESSTDVVPKKMHMVSLDNLVSGRRSRGRSKKEDSDSEEKPQSERRSRGSSTPSKKTSTPRRARN